MKAVFSILFSCWFLLGSFMPGNDAEELAKMPLLYHHFQEHLQNGQSTGLLDFLEEHFSESASAKQEHQNLPFVKHSQPCLVFILPGFFFQPQPPALSVLPKSAFPELVPALLSAFPEAWQPPRSG
jgi:hypothetical protein